MKKFFSTILLVLASLLQTTAQETVNLSPFLIPTELTENANAIVRLNNQEITVAAQDKLTIRHKRVVTVLNKLGNKHINTYKHYNNDTKITTLNATVYNAVGKKIKRFTKEDFSDASAIDGGTLYSDSRIKYLNYTPTAYPYSIVFEVEYKNSSTGFIPKWFPIENYNVAVEKSSYNITNLANIPFRKREKNLDGYPIDITINGNNISYTLQNQKAINPEQYSLNFEELVPNVSVALNQFSLKGIKGEAKNWKEFGKWRYDYLKNGNDSVSETIKNKIINLTKDIKSPIEKAKIVYQYVQEKTRYISVQEGIGGWKPIPANKVDEVGYGDCKGLTNYTKALLDVVGVKSHYSVVWAGNKKKNVFVDFSSMQGNHVILNLPNNGNDIWLECTSQTVPFGFLGDFTDDRNVLVITPEGGIIKRTTAYINKDNLQTTTANINLHENGNTTASLKIDSYGIQYDNKYKIERFTPKEINKYYKETIWDYNNNLELNKNEFTNNKDKVVFTENLKISIEKFATAKDSSYLFKTNVLNRNNWIPKRYRNRQRPLEIDRGYTDVDTYTFTLPEGYKLINLPENKTITNKFGSYTLSFEKLNELTLKYKRVFSLLKGIHPKEDYKAYRKFRKKVSKYDNLRIELIKQ